MFFNISTIFPSLPKFLQKEQEVENKCDIVSCVSEKIALYILSFLEIEDLGYANQVCKNWKRLLDNDQIFKIKILSFPLLLNSQESAKQQLKNWFIKFKSRNLPTVRYKEKCNIEILANHSQDCIYTNSSGEISWINKWNLPGRLLIWIQDPFGNELDKTITETFNRMINQAEQKKELGTVWCQPKKIGGRGRLILYADLMTDLINKRLISIRHFDRVLILRNATIDLTQGKEPLLIPQ